MSSPILTETFDMGEVHEISLELITFLENNEIDVPLGTVALVMTLARCMSPEVLNPEQETAFIKALMEFGHVYFAPGAAN